MGEFDLFMGDSVPSGIDLNESVLMTVSDGFFEHHLVDELRNKGHKIKVLTRSLKKGQRFGLQRSEIIEAVITLPNTLAGKLENIHTVISTICMPSKEKGLFDRVSDYQSQINLLKEAQRAGVGQFIYLAPIFSDWDKNPKVIEAKTSFMSQLRISGIAYTIVYPNSIFFDSKDYTQGIYKHKIPDVKNPEKLMNPANPKDLAAACVDAIKISHSETNRREREILAYKSNLQIPGKVHSKKSPILEHNNYLLAFIGRVLQKFKLLKTYAQTNPVPKIFKEDNTTIKYQNQPIRRFARNEINTTKNRRNNI